MKWIVLVVTLIYFSLQSMMDIELHAVNQKTNRVMLWFTGGLYLIDMIRTHAFTKQETLTLLFIVLIIMFLGRICHFYGSGDECAMLIMLFSLRYFSPNYPTVNVFFLLIAIFIAEFVLTVRNTRYHIKHNKTLGDAQKEQVAANRAEFQEKNSNFEFPETTTKGSVVAFFPYLELGYVITAIIALIAY